MKPSGGNADEYRVGSGGRLAYLHFGQETPEEMAERRALLQRVANSLGIALAEALGPLTGAKNREANDDGHHRQAW